MYQAITENASVARFGLIQMRQLNPAMPAAAGNSGPMADADPAQQTPTDAASVNGRWNVTRPVVGNTNNGAVNQSGLLIKADTATANTDVLNKLAVDIRGAWKGPGAQPGAMPTPLIPAGNDDSSHADTPVNTMLLDAKTEATRLIGINGD